jgi:hypothetical protein
MNRYWEPDWIEMALLITAIFVITGILEAL